MKHYIHRNEVLKDALEDLKQEEHDTLCLVDTIKRLKLLVGAVESISHDELVLTFENKLLTLRSKSDEVEHLQSDIKQQLSEVIFKKTAFHTLCLCYCTNCSLLANLI